MTASTWDQAYGWGTYGAFSVQSGQTVRMGLTWAGDPGPVFLTTSAGTLPSTLIREHPTRELKHNPSDGYAYETTEWITVTATGPYNWVEEVGLSYLGTYRADDRNTIAIHDDPIPLSLRYHVIAVEGRVLAWVKVPPPMPPGPAPAPVPAIAPVRAGHSVHLNVDLDGEPDGVEALAEQLAAIVATVESQDFADGFMSRDIADT